MISGLANNDLTFDKIVNSKWKFYNDSGFLGYIIFVDDGSIKNYNNDNERFWSYDGIFLTVYNKSKVATLKYVERI